MIAFYPPPLKRVQYEVIERMEDCFIITVTNEKLRENLTILRRQNYDGVTPRRTVRRRSLVYV